MMTAQVPTSGIPSHVSDLQRGRRGRPARETILLVEDEPSIRMLMRRVLEQQGYSVLEAQRAEQARDLASHGRFPIHLLLTDVLMPGMDGFWLAAQLVETRPGIRVLYISGYPGDHYVRQGVQNRRTAFLAKPFSASALTARIREVLDAPLTTPGTAKSAAAPARPWLPALPT